MPLRIRHPERGASALEYAALLTLVAVIVGAVAFTPALRETVVAGVDSSVCTLLGGDCAEEGPGGGEPGAGPEPADYPGHGDESQGEGAPAPSGGGGPGGGNGGGSGEPSGGVDQNNVDTALDLLDEYRNPPSVWCPWCSRVDTWDLLEGWSELSEAELHQVIAGMSEEELRELLGTPGVSNPADNALRRWLLENAHIDTLRLITDMDPRYFEPGFDRMDPDTLDLDNLEYGFPENGSVWGEDERVSLDHIDQGSLSDCYFLADIGALAQARPDLIEEMIAENPNGTYTVTFADGSSYTVTPDVPMLNGRPAFAGRDAQPPVMWPAILEQAYVMHQGGDYEDLQYRQGRDPLGELLGSDTQRSSSGDVTIEDLHGGLYDDNGDIAGTVNLSTYQIDDLPQGDRYDHIKDDDQSRSSGQDLYTNHVYVVTEVDMDEGTVTVYNPHGKTDRPITLDWDEFEDSFKTVRVNDLE